MTFVTLPLEVYYSEKKKFILNLNNYRNAHYRVLSIAKKVYTENLVERIKDYSRFDDPVSLASNRLKRCRTYLGVWISITLDVNLRLSAFH